jgi:hypothetical protein
VHDADSGADIDMDCATALIFFETRIAASPPPCPMVSLVASHGDSQPTTQVLSPRTALPVIPVRISPGSIGAIASFRDDAGEADA